MSALVVGGVAAATVLAVAGGIGYLVFATPGGWLTTGSPEEVKRHNDERIQGAILLAGLIGIGAIVAYKTPHEDIGKGLMVGGGGVAAVLAYDGFFKKEGP